MPVRATFGNCRSFFRIGPSIHLTCKRLSLYAKDLHCPREWARSFESLLPSSLRHLGSLDLFRALPKETTPEVLMAYVGSRKSLYVYAAAVVTLSVY